MSYSMAFLFYLILSILHQPIKFSCRVSGQNLGTKVKSVDEEQKTDNVCNVSFYGFLFCLNQIIIL